MRITATILILILSISVNAQEEVKRHRLALDLPSLAFPNIYINYGYQLNNNDIISVGYHYLTTFHDEGFYNNGNILEQTFTPGVSGEVMYQYKLDREENVKFRTDAFVNFVVAYDQYRMINSWDRWDHYDNGSYYYFERNEKHIGRLKFAVELCYNYTFGSSPFYIEGSLGTGLVFVSSDANFERRDFYNDQTNSSNNYDNYYNSPSSYTNASLPISGGIALGIKL